MAFQSTFYDTSATIPESLVTETKWADAHPAIGSSEYGVVGPGDFTVTAHPTTPHAVNVSPGQAWGHGVFDESPDIVPVQCQAPAAGTTRWDLIAVRRDWRPAAGGPTSLVAVAGGTTRAIPDARENTPGTLDDQPLFLVQWKAGQTQPTALVDLRVWAGNGGAFAKDDLVRTYLTIPGSEVNINGVAWAYQIGASNSEGWVKAYEIGKIPLFGIGTPIAAAAPAAGTGFLVQAGSQVAVTDSTGYARLIFPKPFPNALLTVFAMNGDDQATGPASVASSGQRQTSHGMAAIGDRSSWVYVLNDQAAGSRIVERKHRVNWIAIGW